MGTETSSRNSEVIHAGESTDAVNRWAPGHVLACPNAAITAAAIRRTLLPRRQPQGTAVRGGAARALHLLPGARCASLPPGQTAGGHQRCTGGWVLKQTRGWRPCNAGCQAATPSGLPRAHPLLNTAAAGGVRGPAEARRGKRRHRPAAPEQQAGGGAGACCALRRRAAVALHRHRRQPQVCGGGEGSCSPSPLPRPTRHVGPPTHPPLNRLLRHPPLPAA